MRVSRWAPALLLVLVLVTVVSLIVLLPALTVYSADKQTGINSSPAHSPQPIMNTDLLLLRSEGDWKHDRQEEGQAPSPEDAEASSLKM